MVAEIKGLGTSSTHSENSADPMTKSCSAVPALGENKGTLEMVNCLGLIFLLLLYAFYWPNHLINAKLFSIKPRGECPDRIKKVQKGSLGRFNNIT